MENWVLDYKANQRVSLGILPDAELRLDAHGVDHH